MEKIRIYTVAHELGIPSQDLLAYYEDNGLTFSSHLAVLDAEAAQMARSYFSSAVRDVETVLSPATNGRSSDKVVLDFAPFQVDAPAKTPAAEPNLDDELFIASQEAVAKVEQKVAAAAEAPVRQSLLLSAFATASVAIIPTFAAFATLVFGQPSPRPLLAVLLSIILTAGSVVVGSAIWSTQPESAGFSFGDLMLWSWVRREAAERALIENTAILGFDRFGRFLGNSTASQEDQMRAVREIAAALDAKSSYTLGHSKRVEKHARKVAEAMGLTAEQIADLATAAALHDIGNIQIPDGVLRKAGELTVEERGAIEAHVLLGARMVLKAGNDAVVDGIRHHHERWDGAGYPDGMYAAEIPLFARIIGIAEAYDAMTSTRPYRQGLSREHAISVLRSEAGYQFDANLVEVFVSTLPSTSALVARFGFLARMQRQLQELQLLFKRMGAIAVSATASTIAIALILGGTVLSPGTSDAPEIADRHKRVSPIDRVLASRLANEAGGYDALTPLSDALSPRGTTPATDVGGYAQEDTTHVAWINGGEVKFAGENDDNGNGQVEAPGSVDQPGAGGTVTPPTIVDSQPGPAGGSGVTAGPAVDGGTGGRDESTPTSGGNVNSGSGSTDNTGTPAATPPASSGGSTVTPTPTTQPPAATPGTTAPGNSGNAPGQNKDGTTAPGNSGNAPGQNKGDGTAPGNSGNAGGGSTTAPGQNKDGTTAPGNSGTAGGGSTTAPGQNKDGTTAPGNSGTAGGGSTTAPGQNKDGTTAPGNSGTAGGGSTTTPGSGTTTTAPGSGATTAPGGSTTTPGQSKGDGKGKGGGTTTTTPAPSPAPTSPGNGGGKGNGK